VAERGKKNIKIKPTKVNDIKKTMAICIYENGV
jgi:hypothetical protein